MHQTEADLHPIHALVERQFASRSWGPGGGPDTEDFGRDFHAAARLFPAARPLVPGSVDAFAARMQGLAGTALRSFQERATGTRIHVVGNVAVAAVACENLENGREVTRNVEMMPLVREDGTRSIAAQAWDRIAVKAALPADLFAETRGGAGLSSARVSRYCAAGASGAPGADVSAPSAAPSDAPSAAPGAPSIDFATPPIQMSLIRLPSG